MALFWATTAGRDFAIRHLVVAMEGESHCGAAAKDGEDHEVRMELYFVWQW